MLRGGAEQSSGRNSGLVIFQPSGVPPTWSEQPLMRLAYLDHRFTPSSPSFVYWSYVCGLQNS